MTKPYKILLSIVLLLATVSTSIAEDSTRTDKFNGEWVGRLVWVNPETHLYSPVLTNIKLDAHPGLDVKLSINKQDVRVFMLRNGDYKEIKEGQFDIKHNQYNAIVSALDQSEDKNDSSGHGGWSEAMTFDATFKKKDILYVSFVRAVNNYLEDHDYADSEGIVIGRYYRMAFGELVRVRR
jgi:hypothetical protein